MKADLHVHSVYSDGAYTPQELAVIARKNKVELISVTDHDNFFYDQEKRKAFTDMGISYLTGVEISAYEKKTKVHITGYGYNAQSSLCASYQKQRIALAQERLQDVLVKLQKHKNIHLSAAAVYAQLKANNIPVHTMHIVLALVKAGYFSGVEEGFKACFMPGLPTYSYVGRSTPEEAIEIIHSLGGIACLAHPGRIRLPEAEKEKLIFSLKERGLDGIECVYSTHTEEQTAYFKALAKKLQLLESGGSDFHNGLGGRKIGFPAFEVDDCFLRAAHVLV